MAINVPYEVVGDQFENTVSSTAENIVSPATIPARANAVILSATLANLVYTEDGTTATTGIGHQLLATDEPRLIPLRHSSTISGIRGAGTDVLVHGTFVRVKNRW